MVAPSGEVAITTSLDRRPWPPGARGCWKMRGFLPRSLYQLVAKRSLCGARRDGGARLSRHAERPRTVASIVTDPGREPARPGGGVCDMLGGVVRWAAWRPASSSSRRRRQLRPVARPAGRLVARQPVRASPVTDHVRGRRGGRRRPRRRGGCAGESPSTCGSFCRRCSATVVITHRGSGIATPSVTVLPIASAWPTHRDSRRTPP